MALPMASAVPDGASTLCLGACADDIVGVQFSDRAT